MTGQSRTDQEPTGDGYFTIDPDQALIFPIHSFNTADVREGLNSWHELFGGEPTLKRSIISAAADWQYVNTAFPPDVFAGLTILMGLRFQPIDQGNADGVQVLPGGFAQMYEQMRRTQDFVFSQIGHVGRPSTMVTRTTLFAGLEPVDLKGQRVVKEDELLHMWIAASPSSKDEGASISCYAKMLFHCP